MKVAGGRIGTRKPRIEMLPLIDIVFLLLVFFIYAMLSMAVHRSLPVSLPVSSTAAPDAATNITVTVDKTGAVFLDKTPVSRQELAALLTEKVRTTEAADRKNMLVALFADRDVSYQEVYGILDVIRTAGVANVSLQAGARQ